MKNITIRRILGLFLAASAIAFGIIPAGASSGPAQGDPVTREDFEAAGWPSDYASRLALLKGKHPGWTFEKLDVTGLSGGKYTWDYVIGQECDAEPKRNLVASSDEYVPLRDFRDLTLYDSGWYRASKYTVSHFMDTRNFLNEEQIFQFADLGWSEHVTVDMVKTVIEGTFMENAYLDDVYSDMTYADFFMKAGKETGTNPVYIAVLIRSEQGVKGDSALISGKVGDRLWYYYSNGITGMENGRLINAPTSGWTEESLKKYNGYYNFFNMGAAGTGYFQIYRGGAEEAIKGSPEYASQWGGSPSWNTKWKAILGGALRATSKYVGDYQNTFYLQKFNVDPRSSRNFWGQYMQSIFGSYGRAWSMYDSYREAGMLDMPYHFVIPVYSGMPENVCPYPNGTELADRRPISYESVKSYKFMNLDYVLCYQAKSAYKSEKITWRCLVGHSGDVIPLGELDLSPYSSAVIEYSVAEKFDAYGGGTRASLIFSSGEKGAQTGDDPGGLEEIGRARLSNGGSGGFLYRRNCTVDLSATSYSGDVFLTAEIEKGQKYIIHNIVFITNEGYEPPEAPTEEATETQDVPGTDGRDPGASSGGCSSSLSGAAAASFASAAALALQAGKKRKKKNGVEHED